MEKNVERGREIHLTFIDLQKAYDTVPLSKLWESMTKGGVEKAYVNAVNKRYCGCTAIVKTGSELLREFAVTKGLRQGCSLAPTLFKSYLEEVLSSRKRKCNQMGVPVGEETLYSVLFADDQIIVAGDREDSSYMFRKLKEEYDRWGLTINTEKTEYMIVGNKYEEDLDVGVYHIKNTPSFKFLGVTFTADGKSTQDISNKVGQGRRAIRQLNSVLWSSIVTNKTKTAIYKTIVEGICTYGSEIWELNKRNKERLMSLEMDFWRRSYRISKLQHI